MRVPQNRVNNNATSSDANDAPQVTARRSGPFAQIPSAAVYDQRLSGDAFRLLAALTTHADQHGECYPRQDSLAYALGVNQSSISRWLGELVKFGYVVIVGKRRYGARGWRYVYQIQYQPAPPEDVEDMQHSITSHEDMQPRICTAVHNKNISIKNRALIPSVPSSSYPQNSVNQPSLAPRAQNAAPTPPPERAPAARGGELRKAMERDPLFQVCREALGYAPMTPREWDEWRHRINDFHRCHATPAQIRAVIAEYTRRWPDRSCTLRAIQQHWSLLMGGEKHGTGLAITVAAGEARRQREQAEHDAFDWRAERERRREQAAELGWTLEQLYGDSVDNPDTYRPRKL